jgi:hypothetical protein
MVAIHHVKWMDSQLLPILNDEMTSWLFISDIEVLVGAEITQL